MHAGPLPLPAVMRLSAVSGLGLLAVMLAGCIGGDGEASPCDDGDGALTSTAFVFVSAPGAGERVESGFRVTGCSRTFEGNVVWRLRGRDGGTLASGSVQGGSTQPGSFSFTIAYSVGTRQVGLLEVDEPTVTQEEGFPPVRNTVPLVLRP
jgi:Immunoglobulin-like domain of bacterial spore germination